MMSLFFKVARYKARDCVAAIVVRRAAVCNYSTGRHRPAVRMEDKRSDEETTERDSAKEEGAEQSPASREARKAEDEVEGKTEEKATLTSAAGNRAPGSESPASRIKRPCPSVTTLFSGWFGRNPEPQHQRGYSQRDYSQMSVDEKRRYYTCGKDFKELAAIPTWDEFHKTLPYPKDLEESQYTVDEALNKKVSLWRGDITQLEIDAIVNAANHSLLGGGGVDGAIHRAAGRGLLRECEGLGGCYTGDAKLTAGHRLPAKYVLHTVGPMDGKEEMLEGCYRRCLELVLQHNIRSVAFPCIATGIYGYPHDEAAELALRVTREWLKQHGDKVDRIIFCLFQKVDYKFYCKYLHYFYPVEKPTEPQQHGTGTEAMAETSELPFKPSMASSGSAPAGTLTREKEAAPETVPPTKPPTSADPPPASTVQPQSDVSSEQPTTPPPDNPESGTEEDEEMEVESQGGAQTDAKPGAGGEGDKETVEQRGQGDQEGQKQQETSTDSRLLDGTVNAAVDTANPPSDTPPQA